MQIGIVGLGRMGGNMARRLARGDVIVDGGNANYMDSRWRRTQGGCIAGLAAPDVSSR